MGYIKGYNLLILTIDPNFQRDIQVYLALFSDSSGVMFFNPHSSSKIFRSLNNIEQLWLIHVEREIHHCIFTYIDPIKSNYINVGEYTSLDGWHGHINWCF